ncbi:MAG: type II toxin-antitoxin system RelE/ParE family toxin [Acidobacteriota bacterium]
MRVHWTGTAKEHLTAIRDYIARDSPLYARHMVDRLTHRSRQIAENPLSGRRVPEYELDQIREVIEKSYRIIYHIRADRIDVLAVIHSAMEVLPRDR